MLKQEEEGVCEIFCIENKAGVWGQSPQPLEAKRGSGAEPPTLRRFYSIFPKKKLHIFTRSLVLILRF